MCRDERNTDNRTRPFAALRSLKRVRWRRRWNSASGLFAMTLFLLAFLAADDFAGIFDALALVRLGRAERADLGGNLADALAVGAAHRDHRRPLAGDPHILRDRIGDVVAVAQLQVQDVALHRGAIADAVDLEVAGEAGGDAGHHVVDQRAGRAPHRAGAFAVAVRRDRHDAVGDRRVDLVADGEAQHAEPTLGGQRLIRQLDRHPLGDRYGILANPRHDLSLRLLP